jgi:hypothetical protein
MEFSRQQFEAMVRDVPVWHHTIHLGQEVVIRAAHESRLGSLHLPDMRGKSVLDINTMDGSFAFEAERRGASRR